MTRHTYTSRVLPLFGLSLLIAAIGAFIGYWYFGFLSHIMPLLYIAEFILLFAAAFAHKNKSVGAPLLYGFVFVTGLTLSPIVTYYLVSYGGGIIVEALFLTAIVFGALSYYAYVTGQNFSRLGGFLFAALIGIILASLVNIFLRNDVIFLVVDIISIFVFSGYVLYDMGRILNDFSDDDIYPAVMSLYINFLNLFISILELLGIFSRRRD